MTPMRKTLAAVAVAATALATPAAAEPVDLGDLRIAPNAETFELDNGMQVVVIPDRRAPIVTHMVWYRVGSADEPPGKSGIAHYLEHLMFKGTEAHPDGFSDRVSRLGGRENAFTSYDYTGYFQQIAKQHLREMMAFEADRMENLVLSAEVAAPELKVVQEERRSRVETEPSAQLSEAFSASLFINHPYGDPVIGWSDEIASLTHEDALEFYRAHYRPGNAILVVAGDVTPEHVRELAAETYGAIPDDKGAAPRSRPQVQPLPADRLVTLEDERVGQPSTRTAWLVPSYNTAEAGEAAALDVLAEILGGNNTSRLYNALVREDELATSAGAYYQSNPIDDTRFMIYASAREGVALPALETRAREVIASIAGDGVSKDELARAKTSLLGSVLFAQDSQSSLARIFGAALSTGSTVEDVQTWPATISAVTANDVEKAAARFLTGRATVTGQLMTPGVPLTE